MSVNEELQEHAEHAHDQFSRKAGATMAIIAAALAVVAVYGHIMTTEELLKQQKSSDQWAYYQAKSLRRYQSEVAVDLFKVNGGEKAAAAADKYAAAVTKYRSDMEEIQKKAEELERESESDGRKALRAHLGEVFLEIAIVLSSLAVLARRPLFWYAGIISAACGVVIAVTTLMVH